MRVLLLDDDVTQLRRYRNIITNLGHEVEAISEPVVAWNLLDSEKFDAIVSDVQMPLFSGFELIIFGLKHPPYCIVVNRDIQLVMNGLNYQNCLNFFRL